MLGVAVVALGIQLLLGVQTAALWNRVPNPGSETLLSAFHTIMTIGWFVFLGLIVWFSIRLSWILVPVTLASIGFDVVMMSLADRFAPSSWPGWLI